MRGVFCVPITEVLPMNELLSEITYQKAKHIKFCLVKEGKGFALWRIREKDEHVKTCPLDFTLKKNYIAESDLKYEIQVIYGN